MRIGIDGRELLGQATGVGRYLWNLCREWTEMAAAAHHEMRIYMPERFDYPAMGTVTSMGARLTVVQVAGSGSAWWEQTALARRAAADDLDVFFGPAYSVPLTLAVPKAVTLHDISFEAHPEWFGPREGLRRRWLARRSARASSTILTVSEFSRREIVGHYQVDPLSVHVVPNGVTPPAAPSTIPGGDADGSLILYIGARFTRRNLPLLITAFARVAERIPAAHLAVAGPDRTHPRQDLEQTAAAKGVAERVTCLDYVNETELATLYRRARIFAWLSEYEGFGLTPLEALAAGVPAVVGDIPVAREVYGDAVRYVPLGDPEAIATAMIELLTDPSARAALLARREATLARYTWQRAAAGTLAALEATRAR